MIRALVIVFFSLLFIQAADAQGFQDKESIRNKQRVNYIYSLTDYITWSEFAGNETFTIGVLGADETKLVEAFRETAERKPVKKKRVEIIQFSSVEQLRNTQVLYVHKRQGIDLNGLLAQLKGSETLLVTENYGFRESMINFIEFGNELHFDVSEEKINQAGLLVSPQLLKFSIQQQNDWEELFRKIEEEEKLVESQKSELEKLNEEIALQERRMDAQREQIRKQQQRLNEQEKSIREREEELNDRDTELRAQRMQLGTLKSAVNRTNLESLKLAESLVDQNAAIESGRREIREQEEIIAEQAGEITKQEMDLAEQEEALDNRLEQIRKQGYLIVIFVVLSLLIALLGFFVYRGYRRSRKRAREIKVKNEKLVALNESLDSFVYRVSHDLKSPVINVKNMITMLREHQDNEQDPIVPKIIDNLDLSSNRLETTITDLLELSRIERVEETKEMVNIQEVFEEIYLEYKKELSDIGATVERKFDSGQEFYGSKVELVSILQNLLTNSIKYRSKSRDLRIVVGTEKKGQETLLTFGDNGQGIDLDRFGEKLFGMFQRFTTDSKVSGTGVGMYIIKKLVEKNSGLIRLEEASDQGLIYFITLPGNKPKKWTS